MKAIVFFSLLTIGLVSCGDTTNSAEADSAKIPDSVPQPVTIGKGDWGYKPDTMINDLLLGDEASLVIFKRNNGDEGRTDNRITEMKYVNTQETEQLTVFVLKEVSKTVAFGVRVKKNIRDKNSAVAENYAVAPNFITSSGIYLGMPVEYIQTIYRCQEMMKWTKGDTTYLSYTPKPKDKDQYKRYSYTDYSSNYKFVNDQLVSYEMFVSLVAFAEQ